MGLSIQRSDNKQRTDTQKTDQTKGKDDTSEKKASSPGPKEGSDGYQAATANGKFSGGSAGNPLAALARRGPSSQGPAPDAGPTLDPNLTLRPGASGPEVTQLQSRLVAEGHLSQNQVDGQYGPVTAGAVRDFQAANGLAADGIAGSQTVGALNGRAGLGPVGAADGADPALAPGGVDPARAATTGDEPPPTATEQGYDRVYVLTKDAPEGQALATGHAMIAFGDAEGPKEVFNQAGATDGFLWGDAAPMHRMSWQDAKAHLVGDGQDYHVHELSTSPEQIDDMYAHLEVAFDEGEPIDGNDTARHRPYNALTHNCTTLVRDALRAGDMDLDGGIIRPVGLREALDGHIAKNDHPRNDDGVDVHRSFMLHGADGLDDTASPWTDPEPDTGGPLKALGGLFGLGKSEAVGEPVPPTVNLEAPTVLEYHSVNTEDGTTTPETGATVSVDHLERVAEQIQNSDNPNDVLLTFDDGYRNNYEAFKALQERGINLRGVVSVISDATRDSGEADALDSHLSKPELKEMADAGWDVAVHSKNTVDHALGYTRFADTIATGRLPTKDGGTVDLTDSDAALAALQSWRNSPAAAETLADLQAARQTVLDRQRRGSESMDDSVTAAMTDYFREVRRDLSEESGVPMRQIRTIIWPHSQSDARVWAAAENAGFEHGFGGPGAAGDPNNPMNRSRIWMNETSSLPDS